MKKHFIIITLLLLFTNTYGQRNYYSKNKHQDRNKRENITTDIHGNIHYKDNNNNEVSYTKEVWAKLLSDFRNKESNVLRWLANNSSNLHKNKEKYKYDIFGNLQYENNNGLRASLSKDVFDNKIYKDNKNNEILYSKEFWSNISSDFLGNDLHAFYWFMDVCDNRTSGYKEEYKIDIFGHRQYKNNKGENASLSKDVFDKMIYKDSRGNKIEYSEKEWNKIIKRSRNANDAFLSLLDCYLFNYDN